MSFFRRLIRHLRFPGSGRAPYRFILKSWSAKDDVELAARILEGDPFRQTMALNRLPVEQVKNLVFLAPHQDDEAIGAGGTLLAASQAGAHTDIIYITDGKQTPKPGWYARDEAESSVIRNQEAAQACQLIGAKKHDLGISNLGMECEVVHLEKLGSLLADKRPQVLLVPWLWDWPLKHRFTVHLLWLTNLWRTLPDCEIWSYQTHSGIIPNGYVDITSLADEKRRLLQCFRSQNEHYYRYDHIAMGLSAWNSRFCKGPEARYLELFFCLPSKEYFRFLDRYLLQHLDLIYREAPPYVNSIRELHRNVTQQRCK